jgi:ribonuclease HI
MEPLRCAQCGAVFTLAEDVRSKYPGWKPKLCRSCYPGTRPKSGPELKLTTEEVLHRFIDGPDTGVFTDGSCECNPGGPGGWGAVKVIRGKMLMERQGHAEGTTSNRMELTAIIEALEMLTPVEELTVFTDSMYCYNVATKWAISWKRNGWTRGKKHEPVENLDLVKQLHEATLSRPRASVEWIRGHDGGRWNEYADSLSVAYARDRV